MALIHNLGFPRIGQQRELKFSLEKFWRGEQDERSLLETGAKLRKHHWKLQQDLDLSPIGDFSLYDHVLDTSAMLGNLPTRAQKGAPLQQYFLAARGQADATSCGHTSAASMTKWFNSNYHYLVPEFSAKTEFSANPENLLSQWHESQVQGVKGKVVLLGPVSYLKLGKVTDNSDVLALLPSLLACYVEILLHLASAGVEWVQIDEPILVTDLEKPWQNAFKQAYSALDKTAVKLLLTSYFGQLGDNLQLVCNLPVNGIHIDVVSDGRDEISKVVDLISSDQVISLGVIDGRNIWKTDLQDWLAVLQPLQQRLGDSLWLAPSCSLLHVPVDLNAETAIEPEIQSWLAFAVQKIDELKLLQNALNNGLEAVADAFHSHQQAIESRRHSLLKHTATVRNRVANIQPDMTERQSPYLQRAIVQQQRLNLPLLPTTTIGSFPQTTEIRQVRSRFKQGKVSSTDYKTAMRQNIAECVQVQEQLGLDVLVHGEAERNDMVEYFGEQLNGFTFSQHGWVQSYGSRCVKPPILFGDVARPKPMTVQWAKYAQSLSNKPVKGMLTGPVTILNWSFVRDDQPRSETCQQIALAMRDEVEDLAAAGISIIQIDEAALREGLPLRQRDWQHYLNWAVNSFRLTANSVSDDVQIHTHMCYSQFNDIIEDIARMDADVITIETSRGQMHLLDAFEAFDYPNAIGPGVYDIHSPNIPDSESIRSLLAAAQNYIPLERLWVNPDCGLKTRRWEEVTPALKAMVNAAKSFRQRLTF